ncbi:STM4015 family protein [Actinomadura miaoliensis]|uniref:STM4015 family protein n=1 Tax=Actinomadura miaoliensis TaxID=430685 RepID=A0ABP7VRD2_9ACTN
MTVSDHLSHFAGLPVTDFLHDPRPAGDPGATAWRVRTDYKRPFEEIFQEFLDTVDTTRVSHLITGYDENAAHVPGLLADAAGRLPALRNLFVGDIVFEESEISWIEREDITPLLEAFPGLECLEVRGSQGLQVRPVSSAALRRLRFESGGLPGEVVRGVGACDLPGLEHLDLWLGVENYGGDATVADLAPILSGERFPALRHLGLEDAEIADEIAAAVAGAPIVARLESLSLAMGTLTDEGAEALLSGQPLTHLRRLDLHHHFLSDAMMERVRQALPGVEVNLDAQQKPEDDGDGDEWLFVAVSE